MNKKNQVTDFFLNKNLIKSNLKVKRVIRIIKYINGSKKIVLDNQIKCRTAKIPIKYDSL